MASLTPKDKQLVAALIETEYWPLIQRVSAVLRDNVRSKYQAANPQNLGLLQGQEFALENFPKYLQKTYKEEIKKENRANTEG